MSNTSLSELLDLSGLYEECQGSYDSLGKEIVKNISQYGLGVMPKADIEGLFFHCVCNVIENNYDDVKDLDYVLMKFLRISPSKLRSLRVTRSAKFLNDLDYKSPENKQRLMAILKSVPLSEKDLRKGKIQISVSDPHNQALIERIVEENRSIVDHSINPKLLVLKTQEFLSFAILINGKGNVGEYEKLIKELNKEAKSNNDKITKDSPIEQLAKKIKDISIDKAVAIVSAKLIPILGNLI